MTMDWHCVLRKRGRRPSRWARFYMLFKPWHLVFASHGNPGFMYHPDSGRPAYRFKIYRGLAYKIGPLPVSKMQWFRALERAMT